MRSRRRDCNATYAMLETFTQRLLWFFALDSRIINGNAYAQSTIDDRLRGLFKDNSTEQCGVILARERHSLSFTHFSPLCEVIRLLPIVRAEKRERERESSNGEVSDNDASAGHQPSRIATSMAFICWAISSPYEPKRSCKR